MYYILFVAFFLSNKCPKSSFLQLITRNCGTRKTHKTLKQPNNKLFSMKNLQMSFFFRIFVPAL